MELAPTLPSSSDADQEGVVTGAPERVYLGILQGLEDRRYVPGQRLVESDLARQFDVGRNAVREAMQRLSVRGIVDLSRNRSAAIRHLDKEQTHDVLDVAAVMTGLMARTAAKNFDKRQHMPGLDAALRDMDHAASLSDRSAFSRSRRRFYRTLLTIGGNSELQRLYPAIGMHIIYSQYQSAKLDRVRIVDYKKLSEAIAGGNAAEAERLGVAHVEHVRSLIGDTTSR